MKTPLLVRIVRTRPRLFTSLAIGVLVSAALALLTDWRLATRLLVAWDIFYFSFVIGMTSQVSDVGVTNKQIRRTVAAHGVVSFVFNAALLALTVNIAASAI